MTRDYAKKKATPKRKPGAQKKAPARKSSGGAPAWLWLVTGIALGGFVVFLAYLSGLAPTPGEISAHQDDRPIQSAGDATEEHRSTPKPRFDFYTLLKESDVAVEPPPADTSVAKTTQQPEQYILQVGSFKSATDADQLRAQLILINLDAQVEKVTVRNGETWHRVVVGPFDNRSAMARARGALASQDINPLVMKRSPR